jgi:hypothetical protein
MGGETWDPGCLRPVSYRRPSAQSRPRSTLVQSLRGVEERWHGRRRVPMPGQCVRAVGPLVQLRPAGVGECTGRFAANGGQRHLELPPTTRPGPRASLLSRSGSRMSAEAASQAPGTCLLRDRHRGCREASAAAHHAPPTQSWKPVA